MSRSQWHKFYFSRIEAPAAALFELLADMPSYHRWLPSSGQFDRITDVEPYPVRLGSRYHDGKPDEPGKAWWGKVTGYQPPGALDFHHSIHVAPLRATIDVHIHYSLEQDSAATLVTRWLVLDLSMPTAMRPLRQLIIKSFDKENVRMMDALKQYADGRFVRHTAGASGHVHRRGVEDDHRGDPC